MKCPECRDGKHPNCDGIANLDENDQLVACTCDEEYHPLRDDVEELDDELDGGYKNVPLG